MLLRRDYDVEEAADGLEAVKHMEAHPDGYACILLDMLMPVMDGFKVMEYMQQHGLLEKIPVVALTAISDAEGHIKCYESGAIDIIEKPFDNRMLQYKLKFNINRFRRLQGMQGSVTAPSAPVSDASAAQTAVRPSLLDAIRNHLKATLDVSDEEMPDFIQTFMDSFTECADTLKGLGTPRCHAQDLRFRPVHRRHGAQRRIVVVERSRETAGSGRLCGRHPAHPEDLRRLPRRGEARLINSSSASRTWP